MPRGRPKKSKETEIAELIQESAELESEEVELVHVEQVEIMSLSQLQEEKQKLAARRSQVMLKLDGIKLKQAVMIMDRMESILNDDYEGTKDKSLTAFDRKSLAEAYSKWLDSLNKISRLDSVDSSGKAGRVSLKIEFDM